MKYLLFVLIPFNVFCQVPIKEWDKVYGGDDSEYIFSICESENDKCILLGGGSLSGISGNKTQQSQGGGDFWVVKIELDGSIVWDKRFGGNKGEAIYSIQQTFDNGYILAGSSNSDISGDKTQACWDTVLYNCDYWIVKIDGNGVLQWDKTYGGIGDDFLTSVEQTRDGGFILGGSSISENTGDKSQTSWNGTYDYWIVKTDLNGNIEWDRRFGGLDWEFLSGVYQTNDNGYILGGTSNSNIGGDKTQQNWGMADYWIVKIDSLGNFQWDKRIGSFSYEVMWDMKVTSDNGVILAGLSDSDVGGDKTQPNWYAGMGDYWIVKTDSLGNILWDKRYGGLDEEDEFGNVQQTMDGGYLLAGTSYSNAGGDKTDNNLEEEQTWIIKIDSNGTKQWDRTLLTPPGSNDEQGLAIQLSNGCYIAANYTQNDIGGDKTVPCFGWSNDYWVVKLCHEVTDQNNVIIHEFNIFPNPSDGYINISINDVDSWEIFNLTGQSICKGSGNQIDLSNYSKGLYEIVINCNKKIIREKIIIK